MSTQQHEALAEVMALADSYAMTTEVRAAAKARRALVDRLNMKAGVMEMGEKIAWGSDTALMREAAGKIAELEAQLEAVGAGGVSALVRLHENGAKAWAGVPDATAWVDELRGNDPEPPAIHRPTALAIIERLERACGASSMPPVLIRREFLGEVIESAWPKAGES